MYNVTLHAVYVVCGWLGTNANFNVDLYMWILNELSIFTVMIHES